MSLSILFSTIPLTAFAEDRFYVASLNCWGFGVSSGQPYCYVGATFENPIPSVQSYMRYDGPSGKSFVSAISEVFDTAFGAGNWKVSHRKITNTKLESIQSFPEYITSVDLPNYYITVRFSSALNDPAIDSNNAQTAALNNSLASQTATLQSTVSTKATELLYVSTGNKTILSQLGIPLTATNGSVYTTNGGVRVQVIFYSPPTNLDQLSLS